MTKSNPLRKEAYRHRYLNTARSCIDATAILDAGIVSQTTGKTRIRRPGNNLALSQHLRHLVRNDCTESSMVKPTMTWAVLLGEPTVVRRTLAKRFRVLGNNYRCPVIPRAPGTPRLTPPQ